MTPHNWQFNASYRELAKLNDGTEVLLRLVTPQDKARLVAGHAQLSDKSRYLRFFSPKDHLTKAELRYLTEVDQERHFALGAVRVAEDGSEQGLGVGRFVCDIDDPTVADPAVAIIDAVQGNGLGRLIFLRLIAAAVERGVLRFRAEVLAANTAMRQMLHELAPGGATDEVLGAGALIVTMSLQRDQPTSEL